jgi:hypothetical protein
MPCCGQTRAKETIGAAETARIAAAVSNRRPVYRAVALEYTGRTSLTVTGPATGTKYLFQTPGARVQVDGLDSVALAAIRVLRRV